MKKQHMDQGAERHVSAALRILLVLVALALNLAMVLLTSEFLQHRATYVYAALEAVALVFIIRIYNRFESANYRIVWILLIAALPVAGLILYALLGNDGRRRPQGLKEIPMSVPKESQRLRSEDNLLRLRREQPKWERMAAYLQKKDFLLFRGTESRYFADGKTFFEELFHRMEQAERFIFLEYYIIAEGELWDRAFRILRERIADGVEVKIIFDDFGNITRFGGNTVAAARQAGIEIAVFNPVHRYVNRMYFNYRDHRKIAVIDGDYAYTGGINFGDEYANIVERYGEWRDSAVELHGEGAWGLTGRFIHLWKQLGGELRQEEEYYMPAEEAAGSGYCQCVMDDPRNNPENPLEDTYLQMIYSARRFLYITTPYFAVEDYMLAALCAAADGGVDVRLMVPGVPDKKTVWIVTSSYFAALLKHGVRIYKYTPGFLHNKSVMVDREAALIGSVNMDYRSFQLNYEDAVLLYGSPVVEELLADMDDIMEKSEELKLKDWENRSWLRRGVENVLRLFAIWM